MMLERLEGLCARYDELNHLISQPDTVSDMKKFQKLNKEHAELREIVEAYQQYKDLQEELTSHQELVESEEDEELLALAKEEIPELEEKLSDLEAQINILLLPKDPNDSKNILLEIRAGTGGDEAALFARDLFKMYTKYAETQGWRASIISESLNDIGGFKEVIFSIEGTDVFSRLKFESGVHRVQRVPKTETQGRVHTSAATVAVMPEAEDVEIDINPSELRIDVFRSSGPGGQSVNTTDSAVRITHIPTGLVVICQNEKSQHKNKAQALKVLRARLYEQEEAARHSAEAQHRKSMVGSGDRSEKIRTYNFPQGRLTDHRINLTLYQLDQIMMGNLEPVIRELIQHHQTQLLQSGEAS